MLLVLARNSNVAKALYQIALCYISKDVWLFLPSGTFFQHLKIGNKVFHREEDILSFFEKKKTHQQNWLVSIHRHIVLSL